MFSIGISSADAGHGLPNLFPDFFEPGVLTSILLLHEFRAQPSKNRDLPLLWVKLDFSSVWHVRLMQPNTPSSNPHLISEEVFGKHLCGYRAHPWHLIPLRSN